MNKNDTQYDEFDPAYVPSRYAPPARGAAGAWRTVISGGNEIAVVYTDYADSAGVMWTRQPAEVDRLNSFFINMKSAGVPAAAAYSAATSMEGIQFGDEQRGPVSKLDAVNKRLMKIANEIDD